MFLSQIIIKKKKKRRDFFNFIFCSTSENCKSYNVLKFITVHFLRNHLPGVKRFFFYDQHGFNYCTSVLSKWLNMFLKNIFSHRINFSKILLIGHLQLATSIVQIWLSSGNLDRSIIHENVNFNLKKKMFHYYFVVRDEIGLIVV